MSKFGKALREIRQKRGLYLKNVAEFMGWSVVYLSDIERGNRRPPSKKDIEKISEYLETNSKKLLDFADTDRGYIELGLKALPKKKAAMALSLARSIQNLDDEQVDEIDKILRKG